MGSKIPKENMIPLGKDPVHDAMIRSKLKGTASKKREISQQVRRAKEKVERGDGDIDEITLLISSPDASAKNIQEMICKASAMQLKPGEFIQLINTAIRKHSALFGTKMQVDANINISHVKKEYNLREMVIRYMDAKLIEREYESWCEEFGEEQATKMLYAMTIRFKENREEMIKENLSKFKQIMADNPSAQEEQIDFGYSDEEYKSVESKASTIPLKEIELKTKKVITVEKVKQVQEPEQEPELDEDEEYEYL